MVLWGFSSSMTKITSGGRLFFSKKSVGHPNIGRSRAKFGHLTPWLTVLREVMQGPNSPTRCPNMTKHTPNDVSHRDLSFAPTFIVFGGRWVELSPKNWCLRESVHQIGVRYRCAHTRTHAFSGHNSVPRLPNTVGVGANERSHRDTSPKPKINVFGHSYP